MLGGPPSHCVFVIPGVFFFSNDKRPFFCFFLAIPFSYMFEVLIFFQFRSSSFPHQYISSVLDPANDLVASPLVPKKSPPPGSFNYTVPTPLSFPQTLHESSFLIAPLTDGHCDFVLCSLLRWNTSWLRASPPPFCHPKPSSRSLQRHIAKHSGRPQWHAFVLPSTNRASVTESSFLSRVSLIYFIHVLPPPPRPLIWQSPFPLLECIPILPFP